MSRPWGDQHTKKEAAPGKHAHQSSPKNCAYAAMIDSNWDLLRASAGNLARLGLTATLFAYEKRSMTGGGTSRQFEATQHIDCFQGQVNIDWAAPVAGDLWVHALI
jgi:hypothetical protein